MTAVGVVGASARAAVHSLARAGHSAWGVDQFADRDLRRVAACAVCPHDSYPETILTLAARFPPGPVLYTGALENHPHIVAELGLQRELWGNPPDVLTRVRDPFALFRALSEAGFATPRLVPPGQPCPSDGQWLRKPLRSGGGIGIRFARPGEAASTEHYFQEFINGTPISALYFGAVLFGATEQLIGEPWLHAKPFAYCGNIGPAPHPLAVFAALISLGCATVELFSLREHWGLDFVLRGDVPFPVEVNPRYSASAEVLEHATGTALFGKKLTSEEPTPPAPLPEGRGVNARQASSDPAEVFESRSSCSLPFREGVGVGSSAGGSLPVGKAIYYAPHVIRFPESGPWDVDLAGAFDPWRLPTFADIPESTSLIEAGWPVLTFFATGTTPAEVRERLQSRAAELDRTFRDSQP